MNGANAAPSEMKEAMMHLDGHVTYQAKKQDIMAACEGMNDVPQKDKDWLAKNLPDKTYQSADDVKMALGMA